MRRLPKALLAVVDQIGRGPVDDSCHTVPVAKGILRRCLRLVEGEQRVPGSEYERSLDVLEKDLRRVLAG